MEPPRNTPEDVMSGRAIQPEIMAAFGIISSFEGHVCQRIANIISSQKRPAGELAYEEIVKLLEEYEGSDPWSAELRAAKVMNAIMNTTPGQIDNLLSMLKAWGEASRDPGEVFTDERLDQLSANLGTLTKDQDSIKVLKKSNAYFTPDRYTIQSASKDWRVPRPTESAELTPRSMESTLALGNQRRGGSKPVEVAHPATPVADRQSEEAFDDLLERLKACGDPPSDAVLNSIIALQSRPIPPELLEETTTALLSFIKTHRDSNQVKVLLAISAAIRKLLLNLGESELAIAGELLKTDGNLMIPIEVELEVAKMVVHRIKHAPAIDTTPLRELGGILEGNARFYSTPKMVNREKYGATALNSFLGVLLMRRPKSRELCETVVNQAPAWFIDTAHRRLQRIVMDMRRATDDASIELCDTLENLPIMNLHQ